MVATKRMNVEEKRKVILGIYHKEKQVYTEKEIFSIIGKAGVNANSIPDVHQGLVDDGLVEKEKIGGSNFFWSFPAKKERKSQIQHEEIVKNIAQLKVKVEEASAQLADAKRGREDEGEGDDSRSTKLAKMSDLEKEKKTIEAELEVLKENDPAALADLEKELALVKAGVERWTDNIYECKRYLKDKRGMNNADALRAMGLKNDVEYIED